MTANAIYGANGHAAVLCVAGVDTTKARVGYSTVGPGRLTRNKPDLSGYTHFRGSGVYPADGGTSAATPVAAGVVAAVRSRRPYDPGAPASHPVSIRSLVTSTAEDLGTAGYDFEHGYGVVSGCALYRRFRAPITPIDLCRRYPWLCRPDRPIDLCRRYPWLCRPDRPPIPPIRPPIPPIRPPIPPTPPPGLTAVELGWPVEAPELAEVTELAASLGITVEGLDPVETSYILGWIHSQRMADKEPRPPGSGGDCGRDG